MTPYVEALGGAESFVSPFRRPAAGTARREVLSVRMRKQPFAPGRARASCSGETLPAHRAESLVSPFDDQRRQHAAAK